MRRKSLCLRALSYLREAHRGEVVFSGAAGQIGVLGSTLLKMRWRQVETKTKILVSKHQIAGEYGAV